MDRKFETPMIGRTESQRDFVRREFERARVSKAIMSGTATPAELARANSELIKVSKGQRI